MAVEAFIQPPANTGLGLKIRTRELSNGTDTVEMQVLNIGDPTTLTNLAAVQATAPVGTEFGLVTRPVLSNSAVVSLTTASGAGSTSQIVCADRKSFSAQLTGSWVGTVIFEVNIDPTNASGWVVVDVWDEVNEKFINSTTVNGSWWCEPMGSIGAFRVRATAWTSGTAGGLLLAGMGDMNTQETSAQNGAVLPNNICAVGGSDGTNLRALSVDSSGKLNPNPSQSGTATLTNTSSSGTTTPMLSTNTARKGVILFNDGTGNCFLKYGITASATSFTYKIPPGGTWEMPQPIFTGNVDCIADTANGTWRMTEMT